ncbi:putative tricarboxylic transport membrane protein [Sinosporangium album]|uniref:Putative tricarboxylic transport membrane protein n=1 Tax=Sinosporangium album TaxID=504805 RepID=A0A1G8F7J7_9ACTN
MVGAIETNKSAVTLSQTTPIARLVTEYEIVVVPADSPFKSVADLVAAWKHDPSKVSIAGGSAGGTDHILAGLMAKAAGIDPKKVTYIPHSGGAEAATAVLAGKVSAAISGVGEFTSHIESGKVRALAVSSDQQLPGVNAPTLKEGGLDVVLQNWRGFVAPSNLSDADKAKLTDLVTKMHGSQSWKDAIAKKGWADSFATGKEFEDFMVAEQTRVKGIIADMGLGS